MKKPMLVHYRENTLKVRPEAHPYLFKNDKGEVWEVREPGDPDTLFNVLIYETGDWHCKTSYEAALALIGGTPWAGK